MFSFFSRALLVDQHLRQFTWCQLLSTETTKLRQLCFFYLDILNITLNLNTFNIEFQVRCLKSEFQHRQFPQVAGELFERELTFRSFNNSLERTVQGYNRLKVHTKEVEYNLIAKELQEIDDLLGKAEHGLNWNAEGMCILTSFLLAMLVKTFFFEKNDHDFVVKVCTKKYQVFFTIKTFTEDPSLTSDFDKQLRRKFQSASWKKSDSTNAISAPMQKKTKLLSHIKSWTNPKADLSFVSSPLC